jgi:hypothetical protein
MALKQLMTRVFRRRPKRDDRSLWEEPPPDIGVREPRRPRPSSSGGAAVLDPPDDAY